MGMVMSCKENNERLKSLLKRCLLPINRLIKEKLKLGHKASIKELVELNEEIVGELKK